MLRPLVVKSKLSFVRQWYSLYVALQYGAHYYIVTLELRFRELSSNLGTTQNKNSEWYSKIVKHCSEDGSTLLSKEVLVKTAWVSQQVGTYG